MKKIILPAVIIAVALILYFTVFKDKKPAYELVEVVRGDLAVEVLETGQVAKGEKINLNFKNSGRIESIYVKVGDEVKASQELAKLDASEIEIQLEESRISLELAQLNLNKLLAGARPEEIKISETQAENARIALETAEDNLKNAFQSALTILDGSYPKIRNAFNLARDFSKKYLILYDKIIPLVDRIEARDKTAKEHLDLAKVGKKNEDIETALSTMESSLKIAFDNLEAIRGMIESSDFYRDSFLAGDKTSLENLKTSVNGAISEVIAASQSISSKKLSVEAAKTGLREAEDRLNLITAGARRADIELYETQIKQAKARMKLYENQIQNSKLVSPVSGVVVEVNKKVGELVQPSSPDAVIVILPSAAYQIKTDIYEESVVKISVGNPVEISLVAFPGKKFTGKIVSINPAEKIIDRAVYYETTINFDEPPEGIKPGMTADIAIQADLRKDVLLVNRNAIQRRTGRTIVEIFKNGLIEEREITIGARGSGEVVEVLSGLEEGEKTVIWK